MNTDLNAILSSIKMEYEKAVTSAAFDGRHYSNGNLAKQALIRSQKLIGYLHNNVKKDLVNAGVNPKKIFPPLGFSSPEIKIKGFLKSKNQDVCVTPTENFVSKRNSINWEEVMSINIRSQLSSLQKNIDTLFERTFAEALNLHLQYPKQILGELYLIPTHEYDDVSMKRNVIAFKNVSKIGNYIQMFQKINDRDSFKGDEYKYERVCLLICDFRQSPPKLYQSAQELYRDKLICSDKFDIAKLTYGSFIKDLLSSYSLRFDVNRLS